jgi:hypothetical protein
MNGMCEQNADFLTTKSNDTNTEQIPFRLSNTGAVYFPLIFEKVYYSVS